VCSTSATIHMHHCGKSTLFSVFEEVKVSHDSCPMCAKSHKGHDHQDHKEENSSCSDQGNCKDSKINLELDSEIDQNTTKVMLSHAFDFSPAVVIIPWILTSWEFILAENPQIPIVLKPSILTENSSVCILNCTFRI